MATLTAALRWYESLGFRPPLLDRGPEGRYQAEFVQAGFSSTGELAVYANTKDMNGVEQALIRFNLFHYGTNNQAANSDENSLRELILTPVHELFHAIQSGYGPRVSKKWVDEGMAEAALQAWARTQGEEPHFVTPEGYNKPLEDQGGFADKEKKVEDGYSAAHFWYKLGEELRAPDRIAYLTDVLAAPYRGDLWEWLDQGLARHGGLADAYTRFIAGQVRDTTLFSEFRRVGLDYTNRTEVVRGTVAERATEAFHLTFRIPAGERAGLEVAVLDDHPDLRLVVEEGRYDEASDANPRNRYREALDGTGEQVSYLVRLANIADVPADSRARPYRLRFVLRPLDTCSPTVMAQAINPEGGGIGVQTTERFDPTGELRPLESTLRFEGLVDDAGDACTQGIAEPTSLSGLFGKGPAPSPSAIERLAALKESAANSDPDPATIAKMLAGAGALFRPPEGVEMTLLHVFTPHSGLWQLGFSTEPFATKHSGLGGWSENATGQVLLTLPDVAPHQLEPGERYRAVAATAEFEAEAVPTQTAFFTAWRGRFADVQRRPPRTADEVAYQAQSDAACAEVRRQVDALAAELESEGLMGTDMLRGLACGAGGRVFEGDIRVLGGKLEGEVVIDAITGGVVTGSFTLAGEGELITTTSRFTYDRGRLTGSDDEERTRTGPLRIRGTFAASADVAGRPIGHWGRTVRLDNVQPGEARP
jgi:hypothetical protein